MGSLRHSGGIGEHPDTLLPVDLIAVEGHRAGGEQVVLRDQKLAAAAQRRRAGITGQCAAAAGQAMLEPLQRQHRRQRKRQRQRHRQMGGPDPQKPVHTLPLQADHGREQRRNAQQQRRQIPLPALRRIGLIRQAIKAGQPPLLLTHARVGAGGHIGRFAAHIYQLERLPAGFTVQQHGPQLHPDQHCGGGGKGGVLRLAADGVYSAVGRCHQHQQQRTQLAGHMMAPQFPECVLPHVHGQQNHKQQTTPRNAAAQHGVLPPEGGHVTQSVQYCRHDQGGNGHAHQCQGTPQMLGPALFRPKGLVAVRLRLGFRFRRTALRLRPQLLGVLPRLAAGTAAGQQALETLLQRERRLKDTVVVFRQHRVHRIMHHMFQRHAVRRQFLLRFRGRRRLGRLLRRRRTDHGKFSGVLPLLSPFSGF